jgi:hypothetical protein
MKKCPFCAEKIRNDAIFCRFCKQDLPLEDKDNLNKKPAKKNIIFFLIIIIFISILGYLLTGKLNQKNNRESSDNLLPIDITDIQIEIPGKIVFSNYKGANKTDLTNPHNNSDIYSIDAKGSNKRNLTDNVGVNFFPILNSSGDSVAFISYSEGKAFLVTLDLEENKLNIIDEVFIEDFDHTFDWNPDGDRLVFYSRDRSLFTINKDGSGSKQIYESSSYDIYPQWSPDGEMILLTEILKDESNIGDYITKHSIIDLEGNEIITFTNELHSPIWSGSGNHIFFLSKSSYGELMMMNPDGSNIIVVDTDYWRRFFSSCKTSNDEVLAYIGLKKLTLVHLDDLNNKRSIILSENDSFGEFKWSPNCEWILANSSDAYSVIINIETEEIYSFIDDIRYGGFDWGN